VPVVSVAGVVAVGAVYSQPVSCNPVSNSLGSAPPAGLQTVAHFGPRLACSGPESALLG
jgi:hypothetical protein